MQTLRNMVKAIPGAKNLYRRSKEVWRNVRYSRYSEKDYPDILKRRYREVFGKELNLENPKTFNEKIQWSKLYDRDPERTRLADKYAVRDFVKERIGEEYLIPLLGVWDTPNEIDFDALPDRFVLKTNHASYTNIIVKDKSTINAKRVRSDLAAMLYLDISTAPYLELHYKNIPRKIIAEAYLEDKNFPDAQIPDYKFLCFDGEPHFVWIDMGRLSDHRRNVYDMNWVLQPWRKQLENTTVPIEKPKHFEELKSIAKALSHGFSQVRVDLYYVEEKIYFGEMTFTSGSGLSPFCPAEYDEIIGALWKLER